MIHLDALPGTPKNSNTVSTILEKALSELNQYLELGVDAVMIENMHDVPYLKREVGPEIVSVMTAVAVQMRQRTKIPLGIQILAGANKAALSVALAAGFDFIRVEGFVFGHIADEGLFESDAGELLRFRKQINAEHIQVWTDVKKKHSAHAISADVSIAETAKAAEYFLSDGIIVTGKSTGESASLEELKAVKASVNLPVIVGSGITSENIANYWPYADAFIVGSSFKYNNDWKETIDPERLQSFMKQVQTLRENQI